MNVCLSANELEDRIRHLTCISGTVKYEILYRNVWYKASCHDTLSYDRIQEDSEIERNKRGTGDLTYVQALKNLYRQGVPRRDWRGVSTKRKPYLHSN